nr:hypothetical protein [Tanacetum cinerariifolium]
MNPNIYVSCIKQFWNTVAIKQVNDVTTLQSLVDKKIVVVTEAAVREKVFANMRIVGKGFSRVETPLFEGMLVGQEIEKERNEDEHVEDVTAGDDGQRDDTAADGEVPTVTQEPSIPSPTPTIPPSQPPQDIFQHLRRVKRLEKGNKARVLKLRSLQKVETSQRVDTFDDTVMDDESNQGRVIDKMDKDDVVVLMDEKEEDKKVEETKVFKSAQVVDVVTTANLITKVVTSASETVTAASVIISAAEPQVPTATITAAPTKVVADPSRIRKGMIEMDEEYARKLHAEINKDIDWDVAINYVKIKAKEDPVVQRYQVMKRKPQTEAQAQKNMMMYLKNVTGFKLDYFKGMSYDDIHPIFKGKFNLKIEFLLKIKEQIEEEENRALESINETSAQKATKRRKLNEEVEDLKRHLEIVPDEDDDVYIEATPLARKVSVVDYKIIELNNKPYYKIIRADGTHQLYISFLTLLKNFDREDLEALWSLVKERFSTSKPENFYDDFLLTTLGAIFEKPDAQAQVWKNQRTIHGQTKVKSWKLLESCGVHIITFTTTQLILLVERSKDRPPILALGNYVQWKSRIKRYIDTKPNHELIHYCLTNPPYELGWIDKEIPISKGSPVTRTERFQETYKNVSQDIHDQLNAEAEAVQIILTGIDNDIYSTGDSINVQDLETSLYCEFGKFTSQDEWQRFMTLVKQNQELKTVSYHKLYDILKQHQHEVDEIRAKRIARIANPLALVAQQQPEFGHVARECQKPKRAKDVAYHREKMPLYQELEAHYMYMAQLQEKLKCEIDDNKNRYKFLETSNKVLVEKLKDEIEDFKNKNKSLESSNNYFKEANNKLSETNNLLYTDYKKSEAELARRNSKEYALQMEIECAKIRGDFLSYKMEYQKSCAKYTQTINDLNQTISEMKDKLSAHQETISILSQQKEAQIKLYKTHEDKELDKVLALENKVKVLDNIVYKTGQSIQMMNMLNNKCQTIFAKPEFLTKD